MENTCAIERLSEYDFLLFFSGIFIFSEFDYFVILRFGRSCDVYEHPIAVVQRSDLK